MPLSLQFSFATMKRAHVFARYRSFVKVLGTLAVLLVLAMVLDFKAVLRPATSSLAFSSSLKMSSSASTSKGEEGKPTAATKSHSFFFDGTIDLSVEGDDDGMAGKCVAVRLKGRNQTLLLKEALPVIAQQHRKQPGIPLRVGLIFLDRPDGFISSGKVVNRTGVFHLYHYLEFLLVAYQQLHEIMMHMEPNTRLFLSSPESPVQVPWVYVPLLQAPMEVCGVANGINCAIAHLLLQLQARQWYGMESNPQWLRDFHPAYHGQHEKRQWDEQSRPLDHSENYLQMQESADVVLIVSLRRRDRCNHEGRNHHGWNEYSMRFPMDMWHDSLVERIQNVSLPENLIRTSQAATTTHFAASSSSLESAFPSTPQQLTVCYVDRQATPRRMPDSEHDWLVRVLQKHPSIRFWHLHMQNYTGLEQLRIATDCQVMIGVHGNGLSHLLWMKPRRYVAELYWDDKTRQGGYQLLAETMDHKYLALRRGYLVLDATNPDPNKQVKALENPKKNPLGNGRLLLKRFIDRALSELGIPGAPSSIPKGSTLTTPIRMMPPEDTEGTSTPLKQTHHQHQDLGHVDDWGDTHPRHCHGNVRHIHLATGRNPQREMTISFASRWSGGGENFPPVVAGVRFGTRPDQLHSFLGEQELPSAYNTTYPNDGLGHSKASADDLYFSPYQHHITLTNLEPGTTYYYIPVVGKRRPGRSRDKELFFLASTSWKDHPTQHFDNYAVNDLGQLEFINDDASSGRRLAPKPYNGLRMSCPEPNRVRSFNTAPSTEQLLEIPEGRPLVRFGIVGDLGQFTHSQETLDHMLRNPDRMDAVMLVGDIAYTNNDHRRWDTFFDFLDDYPMFHSTPLQIATGNHDVEKAIDRSEIFQSYETRFRMPRVHPPELGTYDLIDDLDMNEPPYPLPYEWGNAYYSFSYGPAKHIVVSAYSSMEPKSKQYEWLINELANVNRDETPWLLLTIHVPIYNTFKAHHRDLQILAAQQHLEPLMVKYSVNVVFSGHIHAHMRTTAVAFGKPTSTGPIHLTVGASGRQCCLTPFLSDTPEPWVAFRDGTHYGYGQFSIYNQTHAEWQWIPTSSSLGDPTEELVPRDVVVLENQHFLMGSHN